MTEEKFKNVKRLIKKVAHIWYLSEKEIDDIFNEWASKNTHIQILHYEEYGFNLEDVEFLVEDYYETRSEFEIDNLPEDFDIEEHCVMVAEDLLDDGWDERNPKYTKKYLEKAILKIIKSAEYISKKLGAADKLLMVQSYIDDIRDIKIAPDEKELHNKIVHELTEYKKT